MDEFSRPDESLIICHYFKQTVESKALMSAPMPWALSGTRLA